MRLVITERAGGVVRVDEEASARPQGPRDAAHHLLVLVVGLEVPERREHVDDGVERLLRRQVAHIVADPADGHARLLRSALGHLDVIRRDIQPGDIEAAPREGDAVAPMAAAEIEDLGAGR
jgi:hypothetical protein